jgi:hypothetical protein
MLSVAISTTTIAQDKATTKANDQGITSGKETANRKAESSAGSND